MHEVVEEDLLALGSMCGRLADNGVRHRADPDLARTAADVGDALLLVGIVAFGDLDPRIACEDQLGPARGEVAAAARRPGLQDHRPALWRPGHCERAPHVEMSAVVVELVHLVRVGEDPGFPVEYQGVGAPRCPTGR